MSHNEPNHPEDRQLMLLERITATVLLLVLAVLGWIVVAAYQPNWARPLMVEIEVTVVLVLLAAALALVSVVALSQTRR
jgi:hypothetical protein